MTTTDITSFQQTLEADANFDATDLASAARGSYVNENEELVPSPFGFALADHEFRKSTFRGKDYTMYGIRSGSVGPITDCTVAFVNKTEDAKTRGGISFVVNLPDSDVVKAINDIAAQIESAARGKTRPPNGVIVSRNKPTEGKKKAARPTKVKLITPDIETHEVAGVTKEKKHWPTFHSGTKTNQSNRSDKEYYSLEAKFSIPASAMSEQFRIGSPWYKGTRCPDEFSFLDIVTSQSPEMTRFNCYIAPAFLMKVDDDEGSTSHWMLKWKMTALIPIEPMEVTSTTPTLGLTMISNGEWDAKPASNGKRPASDMDESDDSDDDDEPLAPPKLKRQKAIDMGP